MTIQIVLADDHTVVRAGLRRMLDDTSDLQVVGEASDGVALLKLVETVQPDVVVMDLSMPGLNGLEATQQLHKRFPAIRILVLSVHDEAAYVYQALEAGAYGYVLKRSAPEALVAAIHAVATGELFIDGALGVKLMERSVGGNGGNGTTGVAGTPLSEREYAALRLIAQGYSNKEIAAQLRLSVKTVETYKARAMEKLNLGGRVEIVRYGMSQGWLSEP